jgi:hypothetical protein
MSQRIRGAMLVLGLVRLPRVSRVRVSRDVAAEGLVC